MQECRRSRAAPAAFSEPCANPVAEGAPTRPARLVVLEQLRLPWVGPPAQGVEETAALRDQVQRDASQSGGLACMLQGLYLLEHRPDVQPELRVVLV
eukprot:CAMPEP_0171291090 /NCGR_PEP_ID=MMETSP0790-20130122/71476_1 /TAXON_ID=2925 /ORGANISM="Alexandrium catenella, Strain OF101" /LENGTH=96 /DNA_ID=CAMNT_0011760809 /DNA_START=30 /DNA_END=317 /DNA_ORIENTATION=-